ncbi:MAG TPA: hypothetical protein VJX94_13645 [Stellaceae bacterium]|nr:hypothetical protein [Stellaceae bacterium]
MHPDRFEHRQHRVDEDADLVKLEYAQRVAAHESVHTTKLDDRRAICHLSLFGSVARRVRLILLHD